MYTNYWEVFSKTGKVEDYLKYKNHTRNIMSDEDVYEQSTYNCEWNSSQGNENERER